MRLSDWLTAPLELPLNTIDLWTVFLDEPRWQAQPLAELLSEDETARAARCRFDRDRRRFVVGRALLRTIVSRYLGAEPGDLVFDYGAHGKPRLAPSFSPHGKRFCFNVSHSQGLALYAIAWDTELGIDAEQVRPLPEAELLAERYLSLRERMMLAEVPTGERHQAFYTLWTRKEAYLKALGQGLSRGLDQFSVALTSDSTNALLEVTGDAEAPERWWLTGLTPAPGFIGALCAEGHNRSLRRMGLSREVGSDASFPEL